MNSQNNFLDFYESWQQQTLYEKREEILAKILRVKPYIPVYQEAKSEDEALITEVKVGEDGTPLTYLNTLKEPVRGYAHPSAVNLTAIYKRLFFQVAESLSRQSIFGKVLTVLGLSNILHIFDDWFEYLFTIYPVLLKEEHYCPPVKELRKALRGEVKDNLIDAISLVVECDSAYKYRFQDALPLLDKSKLNGYFSTKKELSRLLDILSERDSAQESQPLKYGKLKKILGVLLLFPKFREKLVRILKKMDMEQVKLSKEDICFTNTYTIYRIGGRSWEERKQENINNGNKL